MDARIRRSPVVALAVIGLLIGCTEPGASGRGEGRLQVVATTTVIADFVANVGGERVNVTALVPPGGEPHTFDPSPSDITRLESAAIVFANGLGLDEWLAGLVADSGSAAPVIEVGENLAGVEYREGVEDDAGEEAGHVDVDPHVWLNVAYARLYVERIARELANADPDGADAYEMNALAYAAQLDELDTFARDTLGELPEANRSIVSFHEAFGYFADAYGLTVVDTVIEAPGQDPSAGEVAALIDEIRANHVRAILAEAQFPTDLVDRIAEDTRAMVVADLFSDSLGDPPSDTYLGGVRADVIAIADALR